MKISPVLGVVAFIVFIMILISAIIGANSKPTNINLIPSPSQKPKAIDAVNNKDSKNETPKPTEIKKNIITIENFQFTPQKLTINQGETVTWINNDVIKHNIADRKTIKFTSPLLSKGESYSFTFEEKGTYDYTCDPHPFMKAQIVVK